jgi:cephalosporin hydroxylase
LTTDDAALAYTAGTATRGAFLADHPGEFVRDDQRAAKFGFTFAPGGFLTKV